MSCAGPQFQTLNTEPYQRPYSSLPPGVFISRVVWCFSYFLYIPYSYEVELLTLMKTFLHLVLPSSFSKTLTSVSLFEGGCLGDWKTFWVPWWKANLKENWALLGAPWCCCSMGSATFIAKILSSIIILCPRRPATTSAPGSLPPSSEDIVMLSYTSLLVDNRSQYLEAAHLFSAKFSHIAVIADFNLAIYFRYGKS